MKEFSADVECFSLNYRGAVELYFLPNGSFKKTKGIKSVQHRNSKGSDALHSRLTKRKVTNFSDDEPVKCDKVCF